ncbi:ion channel [Vibrio alginolyticus]|uniref:ion channel n=1 Tax=Vibrio alginolyticus TaxID=663 RepID=UPI003DA0BA64
MDIVNNFFDSNEIELMKSYGFFSNDIVTLATHYCEGGYIFNIPVDKVPERLKSSQRNLNRIINCKLSWFTKEGTLAYDSYCEYIKSIKKQRYENAKKKGEEYAAMYASSIPIKLNWNDIEYTYNDETFKFIDFATRFGSFYFEEPTDVKPNGMLKIRYFVIYGKLNVNRIILENLEFENCLFIECCFNFSLIDCSIERSKFYNCFIDIEREGTGKIWNISFSGSTTIASLPINENVDCLIDRGGLNFKISEPKYKYIVFESFVNYLARFRKFSIYIHRFFLKRYNTSLFVHTNGQVRTFPFNSHRRPYTSVEDSFNPELKKTSNDRFLEYISWFRLFNSKLKKIHGSKSNFIALMVLIEVVLTGSWYKTKTIFTTMLATIISYSLFYYFLRDSFNNVNNLSDSLYYSIRHFFNVGSGDIEAINTTGKFIVASQGILGYVFLGLFLYHFAKRTDRLN